MSKTRSSIYANAVMLREKNRRVMIIVRPAKEGGEPDVCTLRLTRILDKDAPPNIPLEDCNFRHYITRMGITIMHTDIVLSYETMELLMQAGIHFYKRFIVKENYPL
jgi:hypothetical protein